MKKLKIRVVFISVHAVGATTQIVKLLAVTAPYILLSVSYWTQLFLQKLIKCIKMYRNRAFVHCTPRLFFSFQISLSPPCLLGPHFKCSITGGLLWSFQLPDCEASTLQILSSQLSTFPQHSSIVKYVSVNYCLHSNSSHLCFRAMVYL